MGLLAADEGEVGLLQGGAGDGEPGDGVEVELLDEALGAVGGVDVVRPVLDLGDLGATIEALAQRRDRAVSEDPSLVHDEHA